MTDKIKKGDKVKVVECSGNNQNHIGKIGRVISFDGMGFCVYWTKDSCEATKVRKVKNAKS